MGRTMRLYALMVFLHVLAVVVWVGGMFLMHVAVRPVAVAQLPPAQRLPLLAEILGRFFGWVTVAVLAVLATGAAMIVGIGAAAGAMAAGKNAFAEGLQLAHASVHLMSALGVAMSLVFAVIRLVPYRRLRAALAAQQLPAAAAQLELIRRLVAVNLLLGMATVAVATVGRAF
ncbi:MAG: CopD family protein [Burkholderiaceae bacterium]|nr:CopD family protein [Burkholderiaceae bacterium]